MVHQGSEFVFGENGLKLHLFLLGVTSLHGIQAAAALKVFDYETAEFLVIVRDYADALLAVERGGEVVHRKTIDPCADKADHDQLEGIDGESGKADDGAGDGHGHTDIEMQILVQYLGKDVQTAGGCVYIKETSKR